MNSLSWFLYLADVVSNIKVAVVPTIVASMIAAIATTAGGMFIAAGDFSYTKDDDRKWWEARRVQCNGIARLLWPAIAFMVMIGIATPSMNTMYAIAASEMGERVIKTQTAQDITSDATKALHQWIKKQIEPQEKK